MDMTELVLKTIQGKCVIPLIQNLKIHHIFFQKNAPFMTDQGTLSRQLFIRRDAYCTCCWNIKDANAHAAPAALPLYYTQF